VFEAAQEERDSPQIERTLYRAVAEPRPSELSPGFKQLVKKIREAITPPQDK
jgi:hypothetical protein